MQVAGNSEAILMPAGYTNRLPGAHWPKEDAIRRRAEAEIGADALLRNATPEQIADAVEDRVTEIKSKNDKLQKANRDFEALFVGMLLTEMKKSVKKNDMFDGGRGEEVFDKMLTTEQAKRMANVGEGFGIAKMLDQAYLRSLSAAGRDESHVEISPTVNSHLWTRETSPTETATGTVAKAQNELTPMSVSDALNNVRSAANKAQGAKAYAFK